MIDGYHINRFAGVANAFEAGFGRTDELREVGAALCVVHHGEAVLSLWGGTMGARDPRPWRENTLVNVWSTSKAVTATLVAMLVDRRGLDYDDRVSDSWPEFGQAGKSEITIGQVMSHQAGLPGLVEPTSLAELCDDGPEVVRRLERQAPAWPAGSRTSYHAMTFGILAGELIRRATGISAGQFLARELAHPLGLHIYLGLPAALDERVARLLPPGTRASDDPAIPAEAIVALRNPTIEAGFADLDMWRRAELPAANVHASARGLALLCGALANGGQLNGVQLLSAATIARLCEVQTDRTDLLLGIAPYWTMGMITNRSGIYGPEPQIYGHGGWGGSFALVDPVSGTGMAYVMNRMGSGLAGDQRGRAILSAILAASRDVGGST